MNDKLIIRPMTMDDLDQVMVLENKCFSVPWQAEAFQNEIQKNMLAHYTVLEEDGQIIGYGGVWYIMDEGHITNIAIHPDFRKRGLGKRLVGEMMLQAAKKQIRQMTLEVRVSNIAAISLYESMGFESAGVRPNYYSDNHEDALIMWVSL